MHWLVKLTAAGVPHWQEQVGCASPSATARGPALGVSVQQTADGGYIAAGRHGSVVPRTWPRRGRESAQVTTYSRAQHTRLTAITCTVVRVPRYPRPCG